MPDGMRIRKKEKGEGGESREEKSKYYCEKVKKTLLSQVLKTHIFPQRSEALKRKKNAGKNRRVSQGATITSKRMQSEFSLNIIETLNVLQPIEYFLSQATRGWHPVIFATQRPARPPP